MVKDDHAFDKYNTIWGKIKEALKVKFHSALVYAIKCQKKAKLHLNSLHNY